MRPLAPPLLALKQNTLWKSVRGLIALKLIYNQYQ